MAPGVTTLLVRELGVERGGQVIVSGVTFSSDRGDVVALMGPSGAGKTTVLRAIGGLEPIAAGTVQVDGLCLTAGGVPRGDLRRQLYRRVGIVFQLHHLFEHMTAMQNVCLAPVHVLGQAPAEAERRARALLDMLGVGHRAGARPRDLSGGEAQRVAIARALAVDPPLLLMDEPTASLDHARRRDLSETLRDLASGGRTIVAATHDADFARACASHVVVLDGGRVVGGGPAAEVLAVPSSSSP
jgi:ABC-type polar amino acid transport system ATPase subunit